MDKKEYAKAFEGEDWGDQEESGWLVFLIVKFYKGTKESLGIYPIKDYYKKYSEQRSF